MSKIEVEFSLIATLLVKILQVLTQVLSFCILVDFL